MILKWIIKCDRCGYKFDATQKEFVQDWEGEDLCIDCYNKEKNE
jgi:formylmethanofuran dehydrogenase subunit E